MDIIMFQLASYSRHYMKDANACTI